MKCVKKIIKQIILLESVKGNLNIFRVYTVVWTKQAI